MIDKKKYLVLGFLVFLLGGVFGVVIGSLNPLTHDFKLSHTRTTIENNNIIIDFEIQSYDLINNSLNSVTKSFTVFVPIEVYNKCRMQSNSVSTCKTRLVESIELSARDSLIEEFILLTKINTVVQDFTNELDRTDFDTINETRIDTGYRDTRDG